MMHFKVGEEITKKNFNGEILRLSTSLKSDTVYNGIVTGKKLKGSAYVVLSRYEDMVWHINPERFPKSTHANKKKIDFNTVPKVFLAAAKRAVASAIMKRDAGSTIITSFRFLRTFLSYLDSRNIKQTSDIKPIVAMQYVDYHKSRVSSMTGRTLSAGHLQLLFFAVETLYELLLGTSQEFTYPWPESSATHLAGMSKKGAAQKPKTQVIPEDAFAEIFQFANGYLERSEELMKLLDENDSIREQWAHQAPGSQLRKVNANLKAKGYSGTLAQFNTDINHLEASCWLIIMGTVGIRVHELCEIEKGTHYSKIIDDERYHFIVSRSLKTGEGITSWLSPDIAIKALELMTRLSAPLRDKLSDQIDAKKLAGDNSKAEELERIQHSCMLGVCQRKYNEIDVLNGDTINIRLNKLAKAAGVDWHFASHQFRRTFAHFVVHNQLGDLRYLRDHYKHWSLDMTALYGFDDDLDLELFVDINSTYREKGESIFAHWLDESTPIAGGLKDNLIALRNKDDAVKTYGSREDMIKTVSDSIIVRSTGIAWCTNDTLGCGGGRCEECEHSVIDDSQQYKWEAIYTQQLELREIADQVGPGGTVTIERTIKRCEKVLTELGADMEEIKQKVAACA
ncbi:tyrosine-type recombinase/integrase [Zhongshania sp. BJYM1]|uniref:tyrosine-type recombinase/integrase n=1 Tax=Zhongshania aquatica TaxID=2965069 RepID=UPI0022B5A238|nr:tyrosine-type recombinase/integrase [Marortus sp. BJYM1]